MTVLQEAWRRRQWIVKWRDPWTGKRRSKAFAAEDAARHFDEAQALLAAHEKELTKRARQRRAAGYRVTVAELLDRYIGRIPAEVTRKTSRYHVRSLRDIYGGRQAGRMTSADVAAWIAILRGRGVADTTIARRVSILRAALRWGVRENLLEANPIPDMRLPKARSRRVPPPTPLEARSIMEHAAPHIQRVIVLGTATGARVGPSELFRIAWTDVDLNGGMIRIHTADKGARQTYRDVPVRPDVLPLLRIWRERDARLSLRYPLYGQVRTLYQQGVAWGVAQGRGPFRNNSLRPAPLFRHGGAGRRRGLRGRSRHHGAQIVHAL